MVLVEIENPEDLADVDGAVAEIVIRALEYVSSVEILDKIVSMSLCVSEESNVVELDRNVTTLPAESKITPPFMELSVSLGM